MTLITDLGLEGQSLADWGVIMPAAMADAVDAAQDGNRLRVRGVALVDGKIPVLQLLDGRSVIRAELLDNLDWYADGLAQVDWAECQCLLWPQCLALIDRYREDDLGGVPQPPQWEQIAGATLGPVGAVNGWPVGAHVMKDGFIWVSREPGNVNEPLVNVSSTWSRHDGTYVVPSSWDYQPGEDLTEDGGATWFRVTQETNFPPSASPSQYVQIDGRGGDPLPQTDEWAAGVTYAVGNTATYQGTEYTCEQAHTSQAGWEPPNVPALWTEVV